MDIVVTVPKREMANISKEDAFVQKNKGAVQFWSMARRPTKLEVGDRVYFVENGFVRYYHEVIGFAKDQKCQVTGRVWKGCSVMLRCPETKLTKPIPMKGFQGFRYINRVQEAVLRLAVAIAENTTALSDFNRLRDAVALEMATR